MSTHVEFRVFSGIDNPMWKLTDEQEREFASWLVQIEKALDQPFGAPIIDPLRLPRVGYTGFEVTIDHVPPIRVYDNALVRPFAAPGPHKTIDEWLFATRTVELFEEFGFEPTILERRPPRAIRRLPEHCSFTDLHCGPTVYEHPSPWDHEEYLPVNACYNYANNVVTDLRVFPPDPPRWTIAAFQRALGRDQLNLVPDVPSACPVNRSDHYIAALLHDAGTAGDYHFLRLDRDGFWSHKNGGDAATNLDDAHHTIGDLCESTFAADYLFVGFFVSTAQAQRTIRRRG